MLKSGQLDGALLGKGPMINTGLERRIFSDRVQNKTCTAFSSILRAIGNETMENREKRCLPFDYFTKKMELSDKGSEIT